MWSFLWVWCSQIVRRHFSFFCTFVKPVSASSLNTMNNNSARLYTWKTCHGVRGCRLKCCVMVGVRKARQSGFSVLQCHSENVCFYLFLIILEFDLKNLHIKQQLCEDSAFVVPLCEIYRRSFVVCFYPDSWLLHYTENVAFGNEAFFQ